MAEHLLDNDFSKAAEHWDSKAVQTKLMDDLLSTNLPKENQRPNLPEHLALDLNQVQDAPREETHSDGKTDGGSEKILFAIIDICIYTEKPKGN